MILQDAFIVEPWNLRWTHLDLDLDLLAQTESVFAPANGHVGWQANRGTDDMADRRAEIDGLRPSGMVLNRLPTLVELAA